MWEICIECLASSPTPEHFQDGRISQQMGTLSLSHSQPLRINCLLIGQKYISNGKHDGSNTRIYKKAHGSVQYENLYLHFKNVLHQKNS